MFHNFTPTVKRLGRKADHSPPPSAEVKISWSNTSTPPMSSWRGAYTQGQIFINYIH
jgi:hypothetical protein